MKDQNKFLVDFTRNLESEFSDLSKKIDLKIDELGESINDSNNDLSEGFKKMSNFVEDSINSKEFNLEDILGNLLNQEDAKNNEEKMEPVDKNQETDGFMDSVSFYISKFNDFYKESLDSIISKIENTSSDQNFEINYPIDLSSISSVISDTLKRDDFLETQEDTEEVGKIDIDSLKGLLEGDKITESVNKISEKITSYVELKDESPDFSELVDVLKSGIENIILKVPDSLNESFDSDSLLNSVEELISLRSEQNTDVDFVNSMFEKTQENIGDLVEELGSFGNNQNQIFEGQKNFLDSTNMLIENSYGYEFNPMESLEMVKELMEGIKPDSFEIDIPDLTNQVEIDTSSIENLISSKLEVPKEGFSTENDIKEVSNIISQEISSVTNNQEVDKLETLVKDFVSLNPSVNFPEIDLSPLEISIKEMLDKMEDILSGINQKVILRESVLESRNQEESQGKEITSFKSKETQYDFKRIEGALSSMVSLLESLNSSMSRPVYVKDFSPNRPNSKFS